jgi:hypothetical protein
VSVIWCKHFSFQWLPQPQPNPAAPTRIGQSVWFFFPLTPITIQFHTIFPDVIYPARNDLLTNHFSGLCQRRNYPAPLYSIFPSRSGFRCVVRVNNREYQSDSYYSSELLARENAALRAYNLCKNLSVNDGMYPAGYQHGGLVQGVPVAIGTDRHRYTGSDSSGSRSGGSSPETRESTQYIESRPSARHQPSSYSSSRRSRYGSHRP